MKTHIIISHTPAGYRIDVRGQFGGGYSRMAGQSVEEVASQLAVAVERYGAENPDGYEVTAPEAVRESLREQRFIGRVYMLGQLGVTEADHPRADRTGTTRKTLHLTQATLQRLDPYVRPGEGLSRAVQWRLQRLGEILAGALPDLDTGQWLAVCAAADAMPPDGRDAGWLIDDLRALPELAEAHNLDAERLADHLVALPYPAMCAVEDVAQVFSYLIDLEGVPAAPEERLAMAMAIVAGQG